MAVAFYHYQLARRAEKQRRKVHRRLIRDAANPFEVPDREFYRLFRTNKKMARYLTEELQVELDPKNTLGLPAHYKVLTCLNLLGTGHYQRGVGQDHTISIAQTTVSKYLAQFCQSMVQRLMGRWIKFPADRPSREMVSQTFHQKFGVPNVLGAIDCTQVQLFPPPQAGYRNRHGITSINTQLVVDGNCRILHINARYPGSVHDALIFNNSNVRAEMRRLVTNRVGEYFLLGDSGYPLEPWIMTPILNAVVDSPNDRYTKWHCKARNTVERANGYLKGSFRSIGYDRALHYLPYKASELIYCCAILYNMKLHYRIPMDEPEEQVVPENAPIVQEPLPQMALRNLGDLKRQDLIVRYFS